MISQDGATETPSLSIDMFGRRIHDDISAKFHGTLEDRGCENVVHDQARIYTVDDFRNRCQIDDFEGWIRRSFKKGTNRLRPDGISPLVKIGAVHQRNRYAKSREDVLDYISARSEKGTGGDNVIASLNLTEQ